MCGCGEKSYAYERNCTHFPQIFLNFNIYTGQAKKVFCAKNNILLYHFNNQQTKVCQKGGGLFFDIVNGEKDCTLCSVKSGNH